LRGVRGCEGRVRKSESWGRGDVMTTVEIWASQELDTSSEKLAELAALFEV